MMNYICPLIKIFFLFQVAELVTSEFFEQGDRERAELKLIPSVRSSFSYDVFTLSNDISK